MDDDTYEAIQGQVRPDRSLFQASEEERNAKLKELNQKAQDILDEVLDPTQLKRLKGLYVQRSGLRAVTNELIAQEIGLSEEGRKKVAESLQAAAQEAFGKMREMFQNRGEGGFDREAMEKAREEMQAALDKAIKEHLTSDQLAKLEALKGPKFEFPEPQFGRGGPGAGGRPGG
ncbi:MAG: hypothetical protein D6753_18975, partial [Planctomycetota bacterium]